ncbi:AAI domain-containing protein [Psidium guajava]|nr:AAI domain-containing protein [Psidium guajava]
MEWRTRAVLVALVLLAAVASHPAAAGGSAMCGMSKEGFEACKPSVSISNPTEPTRGCCSALADADLNCLCFFKYARTLMQTYQINPDLATQLPVKCNLAPSFHC